jgi:hypothetical protein
LVWRDPFFVLDLGFYVVDCVGGLHLEGDGLPRQGLDEAGWLLVEGCHKLDFARTVGRRRPTSALFES